MSRDSVILVVIGAVVVAMLSIGIAIQTSALVWVVSREAALPQGLDGLLERFIDQQIDAGTDSPYTQLDDALLDQRKILLTQEVNARSARQVTAQLLHLDRLDREAPIDLLISTQGGFTDSAFTIVDAMRMIDAPVNTWAIGGCYSAGTMILAAGTGTRRASESVILMVHTNLADSREPYSHDRISLARYEKIWKETARLPDDWFPMTDDGTYYLTARQALDFGIVDELAPSAAGGEVAGQVLDSAHEPADPGDL